MVRNIWTSKIAWGMVAIVVALVGISVVIQKKTASPPSPRVTIQISDERLAEILNVKAKPGHIRVVTALEAYEIFLSKKVTFIDARQESAYKRMHIEGALSVYVGSAMTNPIMDALDKSEHYVIYCANSRCPMADNLAITLYQLGYKKVLIFKGGLQEWLSMGYPVKRSY